MAQKRAFSDRNLFGDVGRKDLKGPGQEWSALREKVGETETMVCTLFVPSNMYTYVSIIEGSLEAKLPTIWKDGNGTARKKLGRGESEK